MNEIVWEDPPFGPRNVWPERLAPFMARPGEWGRLADQFHTGIAPEMRNRQKREQIDAGYEFRASTKGCRSGRCWLYVRYRTTEP